MAVEKPKYVVVHESVFSSIVKDNVSFGCLLAVLYVNKVYLGDHWYITIFFVLAFFLALLGKATNKDIQRFNSKDEAIRWLQNQ